MKGLAASSLPARADLLTTNGYGALRNNANAYRWDAISSVDLSGTVYQAAAYWDAEGDMIIAKRVLDGSWTEYDTGVNVSGTDNHDVICIGIDPDGYIHVIYDVHADALKYGKSNSAISAWTGTLTTGLSLVGTNESSVTYPTFINDPAGNLYLLFRDGTAGNGDLYFYKYTHGTTTWAAATGTGSGGKLIDGKGETPDRSPYWDHPCFDADFGSGGFLHISWHWRVTGDTAGYNRDLCYVKWDGTNWKQAGGSAQTVPITSANCETVDSTSGENAGLTSFNSLYSDSSGNPHIAYPKTSGSYRQLFHAYHNGSSWTVTQLTTGNRPILSDNSDGLDIQTSAAIRRSDDTVYIFFQDNLSGGGLWLAKSSDFTNWTTKNIYPFVGRWSPKYDYVEFERSGNLYFSIEDYKGTILSGLQTAFPIYIWKVDPATW